MKLKDVASEKVLQGWALLEETQRSRPSYRPVVEMFPVSLQIEEFDLLADEESDSESP